MILELFAEEEFLDDYTFSKKNIEILEKEIPREDLWFRSELIEDFRIYFTPRYLIKKIYVQIVCKKNKHLQRNL